MGYLCILSIKLWSAVTFQKPIQMQIRSNKTQRRSFADSSSEVRLVQGPPNSGGKQNWKEAGSIIP